MKKLMNWPVQEDLRPATGASEANGTNGGDSGAEYLSADEYPIPEGEPKVLSESTWTHLRCITKQTSRKFNLNQGDQDELYSRIKCAAYAAAITGHDPTKGTGETYLNGAIQHVLTDWKKEQYGKTSDDDEERIRRILYSPTRYGTVAKMIRMIDFDLAKELLDPEEELGLFEKYVYGNDPIKAVGKELGYSDRRTLELWAEIKRKFAKYYGRKLKRD